MTVTLAPVNTAAVQNRAARRADRAAYRAARAAREAAEAPQDSAQHDPAAWDTPVPYSPVPEAYSAATPSEQFEPDSAEWRAVLAPSLTATLTPVAVHAMSAAVKGVCDSDIPVLAVARVSLTDGAVTIASTDRYRVHRLTVPAEGAAHADAYVTPADLAMVARTLAPAAARKGVPGTLPSIRMTVDPEGRTITWEGVAARVDTAWDEPFDYPPVERFLDPEENRVPAEAWSVNPRFMGDLMSAAAIAADVNSPVAVSADAPPSDKIAPMIRATAGAADAPAGLFVGCLMSVRP